MVMVNVMTPRKLTKVVVFIALMVSTALIQYKSSSSLTSIENNRRRLALTHESAESRAALRAKERRRKRMLHHKIEQRKRELWRIKPVSEEEKERISRTLDDKKDIWYRGKNLRRADEIRDVSDELQGTRKLFAQEKEDDPLTVCDRPTDVGSREDFQSLQKHARCEEITQDKPILLLEGSSRKAFGRTGNNLLEFLHAIQQARDNDIQLGVVVNSWAMDVLSKMWMSIDSENWEEEFEQAFCVKIIHFPYWELLGWDVLRPNTKELFHYTSKKPLGEYIDSQAFAIRALFRKSNEGAEGVDINNNQVQDMCSGINAVFGEYRQSAIYSVIHSRNLEGQPGKRLLANQARRSGCDKMAALDMRPDYVKSILKPLGMMDYPIVFISDGQNPEILERLMSDPEIRPLIRIIPEESTWIGGDLAVAVMSNVFIGNPASSFSGFIAKARLALGFGHNYLYRAKNENGEWVTVCGDNCIYDNTINGVMA